MSNDLAGDELDETRVLACSVRLLDVGLFRIGSEQYADDDGGVGLATIEKRHVSANGGRLIVKLIVKARRA